MRTGVLTTAILMMAAALAAPPVRTGASTGTGVVANLDLSAAQTVVAVIPEPVAVAPDQPAVPPRSTVGIINALCDVTLNIVGCLFAPTLATLGCDSNGDGVAETSVQLKDITIVNHLLVQGTLASLSPSLPGTAFPLSCCGGTATLTLARSVGAGGNNVFGPFTETQTVSIDLGLRAPVVISATPSDGDCSVGQNLLISGSCFILADGKPNVTSVFAVDSLNPFHVIQASRIAIMSPFLIDAFFDFGPVFLNASRTFLIYASGPNGKSRNLTSLPAGAPAGCVLGNEQGVQVAFTCRSLSEGPPAGQTPAPTIDSPINSCRLDRDETGAASLTIFTRPIPDTATITINGVKPKKIRFKDPLPDTDPPRYSRVVLKGKVCQGLPGQIVVTLPGAGPTVPFACSRSCED